jgi:outer membrane protein assembly factor BamB
VDAAGVIYLGSADGHLIAVNPDGTERWRRNYGNPIIAAPAVAEDGSIYFIVNVKTGVETIPTTRRMSSTAAS